MKKTALFLCALAGVLALLAFWQMTHRELAVTYLQVARPAAEDTAAMREAWQDALSKRQFVGYVYEAESGTNADFTVYTVTLRNNGLFPAEMVEIQLVSGADDVAAFQEPAYVTIGPGRESTVSVRLLTNEDAPSARDAVCTYYVLGSPQTLRWTIY